jgi:hypothetical protein
LIGVLCKNSEKEIVREFFELFKTPWEFYQGDHNYHVVISTLNEIPKENIILLVLYGSDKKQFDAIENLNIESQHDNKFLEYDGFHLPIYCKLTTFEAAGNPQLWMKGRSKISAIEIKRSQQKIIRVGYDLFQEISFLLTKGQPLENAQIPTIEIHISILRNWIIESKILLIEIPPVAAGYEFMTCLTHDVDFIKIRNHKFDHTMWGFLYRASVGSLINYFKSKCSFEKLIRNWKALFSLPLIYLGICRDFWLQFDRCLEIENGLKSTFFLIPFKNCASNKDFGENAKRRAAKYDILDIVEPVNKLLKYGYEVGVHGIEAWNKLDRARQELNRVMQIINKPEIGIRVHWLYFDEHSPKILDEAGFIYDSSCGYNKGVGYQRGTTQVFRPIGTKQILELPLNIQDSALFRTGGLNLPEAQALALCQELFQHLTKFGGVLTILWHLRSLAPERLWDKVYISLLNELKSRHVWLGSAMEVINWFNKRRSITFTEVHLSQNSIKIKLSNNGHNVQPGLVLRLHHHEIKDATNYILSCSKKNYVDFPLNSETEMEISFVDFSFHNYAINKG